MSGRRYDYDALARDIAIEIILGADRLTREYLAESLRGFSQNDIDRFAVRVRQHCEDLCPVYSVSKEFVNSALSSWLSAVESSEDLGLKRPKKAFIPDIFQDDKGKYFLFGEGRIEKCVMHSRYSQWPGETLFAELPLQQAASGAATLLASRYGKDPGLTGDFFMYYPLSYGTMVLEKDPDQTVVTCVLLDSDKKVKLVQCRADSLDELTPENIRQRIISSKELEDLPDSALETLTGVICRRLSSEADFAFKEKRKKEDLRDLLRRKANVLIDRFGYRIKYDFLYDQVPLLFTGSGGARKCVLRRRVDIVNPETARIDLFFKDPEGQKKSPAGERNDAVAGNSSSDGLSSNRQGASKPSCLGTAVDSAKLINNSDYLSRKLRNYKNEHDIVVLGNDENAIIRSVSKYFDFRKSKSSYSFYQDYFESDFLVDGRTVRVRLSNHPASMDRVHGSPTDDFVSLVVFKDGEHAGFSPATYSETVFRLSDMSSMEIVDSIACGLGEVLRSGRFTDRSGKVDTDYYVDGSLAYSERYDPETGDTFRTSVNPSFGKDKSERLFDIDSFSHEELLWCVRAMDRTYDYYVLSGLVATSQSCGAWECQEIDVKDVETADGRLANIYGVFCSHSGELMAMAYDPETGDNFNIPLLELPDTQLDRISAACDLATSYRYSEYPKPELRTLSPIRKVESHLSTQSF